MPPAGEHIAAAAAGLAVHVDASLLNVAAVCSEARRPLHPHKSGGGSLGGKQLWAARCRRSLPRPRPVSSAPLCSSCVPLAALNRRRHRTARASAICLLSYERIGAILV